MVVVDLKNLVARLNHVCTAALEGAAGLCVSRTHYEVSPEHLLFKLIENPVGDLEAVFQAAEIDVSRWRKALLHALDGFRSGNTRRPVFAPALVEWFQDAWILTSLEYGYPQIRTGVLLVAMTERPDRYLEGDYAELFDALRARGLRENFKKIVENSGEEPVAAEYARAGVPGPAEGGALARFGIDFTARAKEGKIDAVFGRDAEIRQMIDILGRRRKNNPILVGEAGVGKTAVVEGLALRVAEGDVPDLLRGTRIVGLDMALLQAGAGVKGEFESRLKAVIDEVKGAARPTILFIDEAHTLVGAGGPAGMGDAANLLKPALARGEMRTIAATTWSEYKKYFEKDAALARRFQLVRLEEPSDEMAALILGGVRGIYEKAHGVTVRDEAVFAAARLAGRYIAGRQHPDKSVDLLDTTAARVKIGLTAKPARLQDIERSLQMAELELKSLQRELADGVAVEPERMRRVQESIERGKKDREQIEARWKKEQEAVRRVLALREEIRSGKEDRKGDLEKAMAALRELQAGGALVQAEVTADAVAQTVSDWTGIPLGKMLRDEAQEILKLEENLGKRIRGQDHVLSAVARIIRASKAGLKNPGQPIGVFLFVGPSGTGKTECGLAVADLLFGGERFVTTINMSEFQEKHTVSRLIGSPPGYVGYGEGGVLTEAVRQRPYSVVLLDEVEKADPEVMNLFYQVFDKGILSDGEGREISFKDTVIFMTSNLGSEQIVAACSDREWPTPEEVLGKIRPLLSRHFKPALLARMTVVPFFPIRPEAMKEIVEMKLKRLGERLQDSHRIRFEYDPKVVEQIAARCTEVETGARNVDHILQGTLMPKIATELLRKMGEEGAFSGLRVSLDASGDFSLTFSA